MSHAIRMVVTDQAFGNVDHEKKMAESVGAQFEEFQCKTEEETALAITDAHIVLNNFAPMTRHVMQKLAPNAVIIRYGVGVDNVDLEAAKELGVRVCNVPDYGINEVADHAAAMTLSLARRLNQYTTAIQNAEWKIDRIIRSLPSLSTSTVGLIGAGRIAQAYASRMQAFGCKIIAYDPYMDANIAQQVGISLVSLEELVTQADIVSLHAPLTERTKHILNEDNIAKLKEGAIVINVSRGGLVDEQALAQALHSGKVAGAGLDVFETEPLEANSTLRAAPNLILSPHAAFYSDSSVNTLQRLAAEEAGRAARNEALRCALI